MNCNDPKTFIKDVIHSDFYKTTYSIRNSVGSELPKTPFCPISTIDYDLKARGRAQQIRSHVSRQNVGKGSDVSGGLEGRAGPDSVLGGFRGTGAFSVQMAGILI